MKRRLLLPLYRLDVDYVVRHGRRWSALEHLILWACREPVSAQKLATQSDVHVRLVSECLVNLLRAGWVQFHASSEGNAFSSTEAGKEAADRPYLDHLTELQRRSSQVFMDRLSGEYFAIKELTTIRRNAPEFRSEDALLPSIYKASPFGPELAELLYYKSDDTFDRLRNMPQLIPGDLFAVLEVDKDGIVGLPARTPAAVGLAIWEALQAEQIGGTFENESMPSPEAALGSALEQRGQSAAFSYGPETLIVGGTEHLEAAEQAIRAAKRIVIIHSTFIGPNIKLLLPAICAALDAKVHVFLHWGQDNDPEDIEKNTSAISLHLELSRIDLKARENLHLGSRTSGSHAKIILADRGEIAGYCALVGSCNWLACGFTNVEASVRLISAGPIGLIAGRLASILAPSVGQELVVGYLMDLQQECSERPGSTGQHSAMLVIDADHHAAVRDAMAETGVGGTVLLGSHKYGKAAETTVFDPMRAAARRGARVRLFYTSVVPKPGQTGTEARAAASAKELELEQDAVELRRAGERMHAKFIGWNDKLLVTSFNFLSANPNGKHRTGAEVGVLLRGPGIADAFESKLINQDVLSQFVGGKKPQRRKRPKKRRHTTNPA
jgi:hypothetical protein